MSNYESQDFYKIFPGKERVQIWGPGLLSSFCFHEQLLPEDEVMQSWESRRKGSQNPGNIVSAQTSPEGRLTHLLIQVNLSWLDLQHKEFKHVGNDLAFYQLVPNSLPCLQNDWFFKAEAISHLHCERFREALSALHCLSQLVASLRTLEILRINFVILSRIAIIHLRVYFPQNT